MLMIIATGEPVEVPFWLAMVVLLGVFAGGIYLYTHFLRHDDERRGRRD